MKEILKVLKKVQVHNLGIMEKQLYLSYTSSSTSPVSITQKFHVKKFGDTQEENDLRWTGDIKHLTKCNGCGMKVSFRRLGRCPRRSKRLEL